MNFNTNVMPDAQELAQIEARKAAERERAMIKLQRGDRAETRRYDVNPKRPRRMTNIDDPIPEPGPPTPTPPPPVAAEVVAPVPSELPCAACEEPKARPAGRRSRFFGVQWNDRYNKWQPRIMVDGSKKNLGLFHDEEAAARAYDEAVVSLPPASWHHRRKLNFMDEAPAIPAGPRTSQVDHPGHYGGGDNVYEAIKVIEAWSLGFNLGNAVKYISRAGKKGDRLEDLRKAAWYLNREIENEGEKGATP